ncbi:unnamed protein product [Lactuca saligna]|uniref:Uncharacterized protein n=1 Tax=Lactuca saligna TaxID=75948 RepID=A0AA35UQ56_LACSI|nr:unnamed protein product [Lactuca saligna]
MYTKEVLECSKPNTYDINNYDIYSSQWTQFKSFPKVDFWTQITSLEKFNPSRQKDPFIIHPCWRIAHRIPSTSVFARHEPGQINTVELYFLYCMSSQHWSFPNFATFFLDKCDSLRTKTTGDICIGGLITLIGLGMGLQFPESEYVRVNDPPLYLLDCITLIRMELLLPHPTLLGHFSWLNHVKDPVYILPNPSISTFTTDDPETWFLPQELPDDDDAATDDDMQVDPDNVVSPFEAGDHYDLLIRQLPPPHPGQASGQLASLRLEGNRNTAAIHHIEEQQARTHTYMEDLGIIYDPRAVILLAGLLHLDPGLILPYFHPKH